MEHVDPVIFETELAVLEEDFAADHVILGQRASLVGDEELDATEVLRDARISRLAPGDIIVYIDSVAVPQLCQVQIDPHTDGYDAREEEHDTEVEHEPVAVEAVQSADEERDGEQEDEEELAEEVDLFVQEASLGGRDALVHL